MVLIDFAFCVLPFFSLLITHCAENGFIKDKFWLNSLKWA